MATMFGGLGEGLYRALFEPDPETRRPAIQDWVKAAVPVVQAEVARAVRSYADEITEPRSAPDGWRKDVRKLRGLLDTYELVMDVKLRPIGLKEDHVTVDPVSDAQRADTIVIADRAVAIAVAQEAEGRQDSAPDGDDGPPAGDNGASRTQRAGSHGSGPSPNDQRSHAMNPNNAAHQAAADNRSNQMNPNNPAYGSSRGHR